jgi:hypothetical protein
VPVSQRLIDLLNAPMPVLRRLASEKGISLRSNPRKWELANRLSSLPRDELEQATEGYLYAGSTSVSWIRLMPDDAAISSDEPADFYPLHGTELPPDEIPNALREHSEADPFSETARPQEITERPKLVVAKEWGDGYLLTFAFAKRVGHVIHNFEHTPVLEDEFFTALMRPADGNIEVRASVDRVRRLERTWLAEFAGAFDAKPIPVAITWGDFTALHDELNARLDVYRGKTTTGTTVFDTREYTKADGIADLLIEDEFLRETNDLEPLSVDLLFDADGFGEVRVHVSVLNGSIFIRTAVPEWVVQHVYDVLDRIKGNASAP